jgi:Zn-finger nucleic acid-binding protein
MMCKKCQGVLVAPNKVYPLMATLANQLIPIIGLYDPVKLVEDKGAVDCCPACSKPMENFGYMGSKMVLIDRCVDCGRIWIDTDELGAMSILFARTEMRKEELEAKLEGASNKADLSAEIAIITNQISRTLITGFTIFE